jgi:hypothetical protein
MLGLGLLLELGLNDGEADGLFELLGDKLADGLVS